jgi:VWFA-related protein
MSTNVHDRSARARLAATAAAIAVASMVAAAQQTQPPDPSSFRFKSGVELINVTATVADANGRFVPGLRQEDFAVYEDDQPVQVTHFSAERVPVSLGIAVDTSGSMAGTKIQEAQDALDRFLYDLLDRRDEIFLYRFANAPVLLQDWTTDREALSRALGRLYANGGTAMYDCVAEAIPMAMRGSNPKKSLLVISDGNDTSSRTRIDDLKQQIRQSEVLVYAIGIDGSGEPTYHPGTPARPPTVNPPRPPAPVPFPIPGVPRGRGWYPPPSSGGSQPKGGWSRSSVDSDRVNVVALRDMTDDSGGRTEIIRDARDLNPSTASIADELSKQYYLGYPSLGKRDGRWHSIRVEVRNKSFRVRARRGYVAS